MKEDSATSNIVGAATSTGTTTTTTSTGRTTIETIDGKMKMELNGEGTEIEMEADLSTTVTTNTDRNRSDAAGTGQRGRTSSTKHLNAVVIGSAGTNDDTNTAATIIDAPNNIIGDTTIAATVVKLEESSNNPSLADLYSLTDLLQIQPSDFKIDLDMETITTDLDTFETASSSSGSHFEFSCTPDVTDMLSTIGVGSDWVTF